MSARNSTPLQENTRVKMLLASSETLATVVHAVIIAQYGVQAYAWDPATVVLEVMDDFGVEMSPACYNRWAAMSLAMTSPDVFERFDAFTAVANTFASGEPYFTVFDPATLEECAWALAEIALNRELPTLGYAVKAYIGALLRTDGYSADNAPDVIALYTDPDADKALRDVLRGIADSPSRGAVELYIDEQLATLAAQLSQVPELPSLDALFDGEGVDA